MSEVDSLNTPVTDENKSGNKITCNGLLSSSLRDVKVLDASTILGPRASQSTRSTNSQGVVDKNVSESSSSLKRSNSWPSMKPSLQRSTSICENDDKSSPESGTSEDDTNSDIEERYSFDDELWERGSLLNVDANYDYQTMLADFKAYAEREYCSGKWIELIDEFLMPLSEPIVFYVLYNTNRLPFRFRSCHRKMKDETDYWSILFRRKATMLLQLPYNHGPWDPASECVVCYRYLGGLTRLCCGQIICESCLNNYFLHMVEEEGRVQIPCPACPQLCERAEISFHLAPQTKDKFYRFLVDANNDPREKTCPKCSYITRRPKDILTRKEKKYGLRVTCPQCDLNWCFSCQAPSHLMSCAKFRAGDVLLREWTKQLIDGQPDNRNARRCPGCNVFIQRSEGCNHMECSCCGKRFCYACGSGMRSVFIVGSHNVRLSILGCSQSFLPNRPHLRRLIRGSLFSLGVAVSPVVFAGACVVGIGLGLAISVRFIGGGVLKKYRKFKRSRANRRVTEPSSIQCVNLTIVSPRPESYEDIYDLDSSLNEYAHDCEYQIHICKNFQMSQNDDEESLGIAYLWCDGEEEEKVSQILSIPQLKRTSSSDYVTRL